MTSSTHIAKAILFGFALLSGFTASAQIVEATPTVADSAATVLTGSAEEPLVSTPALTIRYGYCSRQTLLGLMPEYAKAMQQLKELHEQYEKEALHNETEFRRQYTEYLSGQKDFPQAILLKRQRDLQQSMEQGIAFRVEADSLLKQAETELMAPLHSRVDAAIRAVAAERGYDYVVDTDLGAYVYLNPALSEDITAYVEERLK